MNKLFPIVLALLFFSCDEPVSSNTSSDLLADGIVGSWRLSEGYWWGSSGPPNLDGSNNCTELLSSLNLFEQFSDNDTAFCGNDEIFYSEIITGSSQIEQWINFYENNTAYQVFNINYDFLHTDIYNQDCDDLIDSCNYREVNRTDTFSPPILFEYVTTSDSIFFTGTQGDFPNYNWLLNGSALFCDCDEQDCSTTFYDNCMVYNNNFVSPITLVSNTSYELGNNTLTINKLIDDYECLELVFYKVGTIEIEGCMDSNYDNYNPFATINGICTNNYCTE